MKRKKFIKMIMAKGYQRNKAVQMAEHARTAYGASYKDIWENPMFRLEILTLGVCKALAAFVNAVKAAVNAIDFHNNIVLKVAKEYPYSVADVNAEYNRVKDMDYPEEALRKILDDRMLNGY